MGVVTTHREQGLTEWFEYELKMGCESSATILLCEYLLHVCLLPSLAQTICLKGF